MQDLVVSGWCYLGLWRLQNWEESWVSEACFGLAVAASVGCCCSESGEESGLDEVGLRQDFAVS